VPGASCPPEERLFFVPFVWANTPVSDSATKTPTRQKKAAIKTRRSKKADFEVDFFSKVKRICFLGCGSEKAMTILGGDLKVCQHFFGIL
jgi:hypothetical protein